MNARVKKVDLNQADQQTLDDLPGIGPALAIRIVEYREKVHPFEEVIELTAVPGISERMVRDIEHLLEVRPEASDSPAVEWDTLPPEEPPGTLPQADDAEFQPGVILTVASMTSSEAATIPAGAELEAAAMVAEPIEAEDEAVTELDGEALADDEEAVFIVPYEPQPAPAVIRQGYSARMLLLSSLLTGLAAVLLTLGTLYLLNGTLYFASNSRVDRIEQRGVEALQGSLDIATAVGNLSSRVNNMSRRLDNLASQQQQAVQDLTVVEADVAAMGESATALDERIRNVAAAAANFDLFLDGLRDLLLELRGAPEEPELPEPAPSGPEPEGTAAPTTPLTVTPTVTPSPSATTVAPTRTPRPTATPLP